MNTEILVERLHWNKGAHVCQMWEKQNPLIRSGVNITVAQGMKIEKELSAKCIEIASWSEYLALGHAIIAGLIILVAAVFFFISSPIMSLPFFAKTGTTMLVTVVIMAISLRASTKASLRKRTEMHNELMLHQNRTYRFIDYIKALSETMLLDERHLFGFSDAQLSYIAETCLKGLADVTLHHKKHGNLVAKETAKNHFKTSHKLFVSGGLIPDKPYDKYFSKQSETTQKSEVQLVI